MAFYTTVNLILEIFDSSFASRCPKTLKTGSTADRFRAKFITIDTTIYLLYMNDARTTLNLMKINTANCDIIEDTV